MIQILNYCNASNNFNIDVHYNDATQTIDLYEVIGPCNPGTEGLPAGSLLYTHDIGNTRYEVRVQNTVPYAYVLSYAITTCQVSIDNIIIGNASTNQASDGSITVQATGNGTLEYRIGKFGTWQSSNVFSALAPGTYYVGVRNTHPTAGTCGVVEPDVVVGYNSIVCDLVLGNIQTTANSLTVIDYDTELITGEPVEYRLDAGAWQDSPAFTSLAPGTYNVQIRFKNWTSCTDDRDVTLAVCDINIGTINIVHEQNRYGDDGQIEIIATSSNGPPIQYSKDNGSNYQAGNVFTGLSPGTYNIRVKDANNCEAFQQIVVLPFRVPHVEFPQANADRFVFTSGPSQLIPSARQNFDNKLLTSMVMPGVEPCIYRRKVELNDAVPFQFRSNYTTNTLKVYTEAGVLTDSLTPDKKTSNLDKSELHEDAYFADAGLNQVQIYFATGLPEYFEVGQDIVVTNLASLNGTYEIVDIRAGTLEAVGYSVLIIDKVWPGGTLLQADVTLTYDALPYEVFELAIPWSLWAAGKYYMILEGSSGQFTDYVARSEPVETAAAWDECMKLLYYNIEDAFKIMYSTGIQHVMRVEGFLDWPKPGGKRTVHEDSQTRLIKLQENVTRNPEMNTEALPAWLHEKIALALAHDTVQVDDVQFTTEEDYDAEYFESDSLGNGKCKLRQKEFLAENTDDSGDVDTTVLEVNGILLRVNP